MKCALCEANLAAGTVNHIMDFKERIIIVKNVPASVCEQCGEYYVDTDTALALESIVEQAKKNKAEVLIVRYNELVA